MSAPLVKYLFFVFTTVVFALLLLIWWEPHQMGNKGAFITFTHEMKPQYTKFSSVVRHRLAMLPSTFVRWLPCAHARLCVASSPILPSARWHTHLAWACLASRQEGRRWRRASVQGGRQRRTQPCCVVQFPTPQGMASRDLARCCWSVLPGWWPHACEVNESTVK